MSQFHLAEINIARLREPEGHPQVADFFAMLDSVNAEAEAAPGFVWRLAGEDANAEADAVFGDPLLAINMSVWETLEQLMVFVYRNPVHLEAFRRRRDWFEKMDVYLAMWWVPAGHIPTPAEAKQKLEHLAIHGSTAEAFTFRERVPAPTGQSAFSIR